MNSLHMPWRRSIHLLLLAALVWLALPPAPAAQAEEEQRCFPETKYCIRGRFLEYWEQHGGLAVFGYPIGRSLKELSRDTGEMLLAQSFERARFELHPDNSPPYDVLLGRLGADLLRDWTTEPTAKGPQAGCRWFAQTQHNVCDQADGAGFKSYWQRHGLEFDGRPGVSAAESLALFGYPLSEPRIETNNSGHTVLTQWFERARFEWHPHNPAGQRVLLGHLGYQQTPFVLLDNPGLPGRLLLESHHPDSYKANWALYGVQADGSRADRLPLSSDAAGGATFGALSPDGQRLAARCPDRTGLCIINLNSGAIKRLHSDGNSKRFGWSPDGQHINYVLALPEAEDSYEDDESLYAIDADGTNKTLLWTEAETADDQQVRLSSWSPDGRQLAFALRKELGSEGPSLYVVNRDGTGLRELVANAGSPSWSPDGRHIIFIADPEDDYGPYSATDLYRTNLDGQVTQLTATPEVSEWPAVWAPDGQRFAFIRSSASNSRRGFSRSMSLHIMDADGSRERQVLEQSDLCCLDWSPDGAYLAANYNPPWGTDSKELLVLKADGSEPAAMILQCRENNAPCFQFIGWLPQH